MDAYHIVEKLKATPYKFTQANKFKDLIKTLPVDERNELLGALRCEAAKDCNLDINEPLKEIVADIQKIQILE
jgi:hypothetical protein